MKFKYFAMAALVFGSLAFVSCGDDKKESGEKDQNEDVNSSSDNNSQMDSMSDDLEEWTTVEQEAMKVCDGICELQSLGEKAMNGEDVDAEMRKLQDEMEDLSKELEVKYGDDGNASDEDKEAFMQVLKDCDCE